MLDGGLGIKENKKLALQKFQRAAELGHSDSQYNLAQRYLRGEVVEQNISKAIYYFKMAANQGDAKSNYNLGIIYYLGELIPKDLEKALNYFETAFSLGYVDAEKLIDEVKEVKSNLDEGFPDEFLK